MAWARFIMLKVGLALVVVAGIAGGFWWLNQAEQESVDYLQQRVVVERGAIQHILRETGVFAPRDAQPVQAPMKGRLEWLVMDGVWVEAGDKVFVINEGDALEEVSEKRHSLFTKQQELELALMRREQAEIEEAIRVRSAERKVELARFEEQVLATTPKGGSALQEVHEALLPLEEQADALRTAFEKALFAFQKAEYAYLDAYESWQEQRDRILRLQADKDEIVLGEKTGVEKKEQGAASPIEKIEQQIAELRQALPALATKRDEAQASMESSRKPMDDAEAKLRAQEQKMQPLYVSLEVEKRGVQLTTLRLEEKISVLDLEEAESEYANAKKSFELGTLSESRLENHADKVASSKNALAILRERIAIAERPPAAEELLEAKLKRERAEVKAEKARAVRDRALQKHDVDIALKKVEIAKLEHDIDEMVSTFPSILESSVLQIKEQLAELGSTETEKRQALQAEYDAVHAQWQEAMRSPPNNVTAPVSGVAKVITKRGRQIQIGDTIDLSEVVVELHPQTNLEVDVRINEVNVRHVTPGQPVSITVPALGDDVWTGEVISVAGAGRDKFEPFSDHGEVQSGVIEFPTRVRVDRIDDQFRQGMTIVASIVLAEEDDVLYVPRAAVRETDGKFSVQVEQAVTQEVQIEGRYFGDNYFIITQGLQEGDAVLFGGRQ